MQPEVKWIMEYLDRNEVLPEMYETMSALLVWSVQKYNYDSKNKRIKEWNRSMINSVVDPHYDILCHILAGVLLQPEGMTYQAMIGYISGGIGCAAPLDRIKCAAEVIAIAYQCDLIVITKVSDKTLMITTEYTLGETMPEFPKHRPEFRKPEPILFNPILGNQFKQHDKDVCVDHINKMNSIPLTLEYRVITELEETSKAVIEYQEQLEQWEDFKQKSLETYSEAARKNEFYLLHNMDTRGRCYCDGYYINYQGSSFKKAIVQLHDKEIVKL